MNGQPQGLHWNGEELTTEEPTKPYIHDKALTFIGCRCGKCVDSRERLNLPFIDDSALYTRPQRHSKPLNNEG